MAMRSQDSERPFLIYVNNSVIEDPRNLQIIFRKIFASGQSFMSDDSWKYFLKAIDNTVHFASQKRSPDGMQWLAEMKFQFKYDNPDPNSWVIHDSIFYSSYSCNCPGAEGCKFDRYRENVIKYFASLGNTNINCYQCDQVATILFLENVVNGKYLNNIEPFDNKTNIHHTKSAFANMCNLLEFKDIFQSVNQIDLDECIGRITLSRPLWLQRTVLKIFADDFMDFIIFNNHRLLKKCSFCQKFHIRKTVKKEEHYFCSEKCKNAFKNANKTPEQNIAAVNKTRASKRAEKKLSEFKRDIERMAYAGNNGREISAEIQPRIDREIAYMIKKGSSRRQAENYYKEVCKHPKMCKP
jgi:endogenous inhibitor of DNA gyrase (YacG/DUF329 family)